MGYSYPFIYPINLYQIKPFIDMKTGTLVKNCDDSNRAFYNLINFNSTNLEEICLFTDGSRTKDENDCCVVSSAI